MNERISRFSPAGRSVSSRSNGAGAAIALACSTAALTVVRFWFSSSPFPPGLDGAQWLSYGRALFGGTERGAESTYAPLIPILAHGLSLCVGPTLGLRALAALTLTLLAAAVWMLSVRVLGMIWGSLATALVLPSTAMAEPIFYGGYPQQAALAFGILGMTALLEADHATSPGHQQRALALASIAFLLASSSHLLYGPLFLASGALVALGVSVGKRKKFRFLRQTAATLVPATVVSLAIVLDFFRSGYNAPLTASQRTLWEAWVYATRESPGLWSAIVIGGITASSAVVLRSTTTAQPRFESNKLPDAVLVGLSLAMPSAILLGASGQPRLVPPLLLGGVVLFAFTCRVAVGSQRKALPAVLAAWSLATLWLAWTTTGLTREFASYYQVLDASLLSATRSIPPANPGSVAVAADRRGWPTGWWVEALQERPVLTGSNPQWLAFPDERARAEAAASLFSSPDALALQERAGGLEVAYLVMRKWDWIGWERWIDGDTGAVAIVYDDNETIVLGIEPVSP